jgi:hypothetical protein
VFNWIWENVDSETFDKNFAAHFESYRQEHHEYLEDRDERIKTQVTGDADMNIVVTKPSQEDVDELLKMMGVKPAEESE